jgi:hypothetical protein
MNNYNKFYNKKETVNEMKKQSDSIYSVNESDEYAEESKVCKGDECENCTCEVANETLEIEVVNETVEIEVVNETVEREVGNCEYLNLREAPSIQSKVLSVINRGITLTLLQPISDDDKWVKVRVHKTGVEGFVMRDYTI